MPKEAFNQIGKRRDALYLKFRLFYPETGGSLFITIPTGEHERCHAQVLDWVKIDLVSMGKMPTSWCSSQGTRFYGVSGGGGGKEGDSGYIPYPERLEDDWPTLVIECGKSQSLRSLRQTMEWWFRESAHQVKIVLLIKLYERRKIMLVEKYTESVSQRSDPPTTSGALAVALRYNTLRPFLRHTNFATRETNPVRYEVVRGDLLLEFFLLQDRPPVAGAGERQNVIIDERMLADCARAVWGLRPSQ